MHILYLYVSLSLPLLWHFGLYSGHGLPSFLPPILFCATKFHFIHVAGRMYPSLCYLSTCYVVFLQASSYKDSSYNLIWDMTVFHPYEVTSPSEVFYLNVG